MKEKADAFEIFYDVEGRTLHLAGYENRIADYVKWLKELLEKDKPKASPVNNKPPEKDDYV